MNNKKDINQLIENFIAEERNTESNPFLSTRIMAAIEKRNSRELMHVPLVWKTALVAFSLAAAVFTGIAAGNLYQSKNDESEALLINDDTMENFGFYNQIGND